MGRGAVYSCRGRERNHLALKPPRYLVSIRLVPHFVLRLPPSSPPSFYASVNQYRTMLQIPFPPFFLSFPVSHSLPASVAVCPLISLDSLHYFYGRDSRRRATLETPPLYRMRCGIAALRWTLSATAPPSAPAPRPGTFRGHSSSSRSGWIEQAR